MQNLSKMHFIWPFLSNFTNIRHLFFLMSVICTKDNKAAVNCGNTSVLFKINSSLNILLVIYCVFHFYYRIFKFLLQCYYFTKFCKLASLDSKTSDLWIFFKIFRKIRFLCLVFVNWKNMTHLIFLVCIICTNGYWAIVNWGYIKRQIPKNKLLNETFC